MKTLIIEDERSLAREMKTFLEKAFYLCDTAYNAADAKKLMIDNEYDFILLDLGLPDKDGLDLLDETKKMCPDASYIILTARGDLEDRIKGLDLGADDYLPKPFSLLELQSRMHAISRRKSGNNDPVMEIGDFTVDLNKRIVSFEEKEIELSRKEFDLLSYMILHKNRPLTRLQLSEHIWGNFSDGDVHIKNIRKKMSVHAPVDWLQTLRGIGYKIKM
jgi:two-component system OmpR family response regulator